MDQGLAGATQDFTRAESRRRNDSLDTPTGNLDPPLAAEIMTLFESLPAQGTTVLVASHDLPLVKRMRKRVLVLDHGRLMDDIAATELAG